MARRVAYMRSARYAELCRRLPRNAERAGLVEGLIEATGVLERVEVHDVDPATEGELAAFHTRSYLKALKRPSQNREDLEELGLVDDCPVFEGVHELAALEAGGSLQASDLLAYGDCDTAIWWGGGRHHAMSDHASGYCYVNDCNLAILRLLKTFQRVLYVDIDVHHCDGVEDAFAVTDRVLTLSFHHHGLLFFPGTGGGGGEAPAAVNVPLAEGCSDGTFIPLFDSLFSEALHRFDPSAIVLQCGADALAGDPVGVFNLTASSYLRALEACAAPGIPLLVLGGGGYHPPSVAKLWALLTQAAAGIPDCQRHRDVPPHEGCEAFAPDFGMQQPASGRRDANTAFSVRAVAAPV